MVDECLYDIISVLNDFSTKNGISREISPAAIVLGRQKLNCSNRKLSFGAYCEVYVGTTNDGTPRSVSTIGLRPSNERGGYYFMSLDTGRRLHAHIWNELPISERIINLVQELATAEDALDLDEDGVPIMEWEIGAPIINEDDNENNDGDIDDSSSNCISEIENYEDEKNNDDDGINDSDGNGISEINDHLSEIDDHSDDNETYENNNKDTLSESDDYSNDDDNYEDLKITANTEDKGAQRPTRNTKVPKRLTITHENITGKTYEIYESSADPSYSKIPKEVQFMTLDTPLSHIDKQKLYETSVNAVAV